MPGMWKLFGRIFSRKKEKRWELPEHSPYDEYPYKVILTEQEARRLKEERVNQVNDAPELSDDEYVAILHKLMNRYIEIEKTHLWKLVTPPKFFIHRRIELFYWYFVRFVYRHPGYVAVFTELLQILDKKGDIPSVVVKYMDSEAKLFQTNGILEQLRKVPLYLHTLNVAEIGAQKFEKYSPFNYHLYMDRWLIMALGHDIGKIKVYDDPDAGKRKLEHVEYSIAWLEDLLSTASCVAPGVKEQILTAVYHHHGEQDWNIEDQVDKIFAQFLREADAEARKKELQMKIPVEAKMPQPGEKKQKEPTREEAKPEPPEQLRKEEEQKGPAPKKVAQEPPKQEKAGKPGEPERVYTTMEEGFLLQIIRDAVEKGLVNRFQPLLSLVNEQKGLFKYATNNLVVYDEKKDVLFIAEKFLRKACLDNKQDIKRLIQSLISKKAADFKAYEVTVPAGEGNQVSIKLKLLRVKDRKLVSDALGLKKFKLPRNLLEVKEPKVFL